MTNPTRAQRLGLESGSLEPIDGQPLGELQTKLLHSIAISLKRIADQNDRMASEMAEIKAARKATP